MTYDKAIVAYALRLARAQARLHTARKAYRVAVADVRGAKRALKALAQASQETGFGAEFTGENGKDGEV